VTVIIWIQPTDKFTVVDETKVRVWEGKTDTGCPVLVLVKLIMVVNTADQAEFAQALQEVEPPPEARAKPIDLRTL
jgi:hypothetical protein